MLLGGSSVDPQGALAWLKSQPESEAAKEFWGAVMDGVAAKDSALALQMLRDVPDQYSATDVCGTVNARSITIEVPPSITPPFHLKECLKCR